MTRKSVTARLTGHLLALPLLLATPALAQISAIATYHYDSLRTGWNQNETVLTPAALASGGFGLLSQTTLDEQVDAQPLFAARQTIAGVHGPHDVVYVATENNTIYAIDAGSGAILLSQNFGPPVPISALPGQCNNNSNNIGINSTPVLDAAANTLYAITYTYESGVPTFRLHSINASTLTDNLPPVVAGGGAALRNGHPSPFISANSRQRAALLEANGNIYAGFASWCDINANVSRGWVLGWNALTLAQLPVNDLLDRLPKSPDSFFLSSVWMSGYGIASDALGSLFFVTGNSDYDGKTYNSAYNLAESVVKLSPDLTTVESFFTPAGGPNNPNGWQQLDMYDADFGSAGVLLLPDQPGPIPHLAVAAGKAGPMYLLNRDHLGGLGPKKVTLGTYNNNGCWCGQSYFVGGDNVPRVVESTGNTIDIWKVQTAPAPSLTYETGTTIPSGQNPGFFTTISSNGTTPGTAIIWAVGRPTDSNPADVSLSAVDPASNAARLFRGVAGTWPFAANANANIVPVVANGHVFVASYGNLSIFGLGANPGRPFVRPPRPPALYVARAPHALTGVVTAIEDTAIMLRLRNGTTVRVNTEPARAAHTYAPPAVGAPSLVEGEWHGKFFTARFVLHAKPGVMLWQGDR